MTVSSDDDLTALKGIGRIVADTLEAMGKAFEPGMTTLELDRIGRRLLDDVGARPAPELAYGFPGATCISVNEEIAHGVPGERRIEPGDLVNVDVSAERDGYFADTGASFAVRPVARMVERLCRDGRRALWTGLREVGAGKPLAGIGRAVGAFAQEWLHAGSQPRRPRRGPFAARTADRNRDVAERFRAPHHGERAGIHRRAVPVARRPVRRGWR